MPSFNTIEEYISLQPEVVQKILKKISKEIAQAAPKSVPCIKYGMPTYFQEKNLVHFAAWKEHIGLYLSSSAIKAFNNKLKGYTYPKGTIQFPYKNEMPFVLIAEIVKFRVNEVLIGKVKQLK